MNKSAEPYRVVVKHDDRSGEDFDKTFESIFAALAYSQMRYSDAILYLQVVGGAHCEVSTVANGKVFASWRVENPFVSGTEGEEIP